MLSFNRNINKRIKQQSKLDTHWEIPLPNDILQHTLFGYLGSDEAAILAKASIPFAKSCQKQFEVARLLEHVAKGEQDEAKKMLEKDQSLLLQKSNAKDLSGREFYQITAFQYALWALDRHMWEMLLKHLPENKAAKQLEELETAGIEYTKPASGNSKAFQQTEAEKHHFDFSLLIAALRDYVDNFDTRNWDQREAAWCKNVGCAQKDVPAHVAEEYCRLDRGFFVPEFKEATLPRHFNFFNNVSGTNSSWFADTDLGSKFAIIRGWPLGAHAASGRARCDWSSASFGLAAITALCQVRTNELEILKDKLLTKTMTPVPLRR